MTASMRMSLLLACALALLTSAGQLPVPPDGPMYGIGRICNVAYTDSTNPPQLLDVYLPADDSSARPMVIYIHSGSWQEGDKGEHPEMYLPLVEAGFVVFCINYRLTGEAAYPAQIYDCKAAVRWARAHAQEYGGDPERIAAVGASAGAHLAALLGTTGDVKELEGNEGSAGVSSRVQAVVDWFGPTDLTLVQAAEGYDITPVVMLLGGEPKERMDMAKLASPAAFVSADDPPFLIIHGTDDPVVPFVLSQVMAGKLSAAGASAELIPVAGGKHGKFVDTEPSQDELMARSITFLDEVLEQQ
jgi:acetyl esterase/lipase